MSYQQLFTKLSLVNSHRVILMELTGTDVVRKHA